MSKDIPNSKRVFDEIDQTLEIQEVELKKKRDRLQEIVDWLSTFDGWHGVDELKDK